MAKQIEKDIADDEKKVSKSKKTSAKNTKDELVPATKTTKPISKAEKEKSTTKQEDKKAKTKSSEKTITKEAKVESVTTKKKSTSKSKESKSTNIKAEDKVDDLVGTIAEKIETKKSAKKVEKAQVETIEKSAEPTVRYSDEDLAEFSDVINEAKTEALDELRMLKDRLDDLTSFDAGEDSMIYSMHMAEQGSEAQEKEKTYAQIQRIGEHIKKLDDAMDRIKDKTYGICRVCGCLIAKERLLAVPITTLSASYKIQSKCPEDGIDRIEPLKM